MKPENLNERVLSIFTLTDKQKSAAKARTADLAVTAGAGSGKTNTLVARYTSLLADDHPLRSVVAITFTEKAALEMRSRVRSTLQKLISTADSQPERQFWIGLNAQMDSARIGTIHSLCLEILRAHPVEARIDPKFTVLDEAEETTLKFQLVDDTLAELVNQEEYRDLFRILSISALKNLLKLLITKRLETVEVLDKSTEVFLPLQQVFQAALSHPDIAGPINDFREISEQQLIEDAGEKLADQIISLRSVWDAAESTLMQGDIVSCAINLYDARRNYM
jgi:ATP-dependent helicase/nuclease subunit A